MTFTYILTQYARIFSSPLKKNTIFLFPFLTFWLNAIVTMVTPPLTVFYLPQFTENPHTPNRYLHYTSHHPKHQKLTVAKTLLSRVNTHITDKTQKHSELQNIRNILRLNGFPTRTTFLTSSRQQSHNTQYNHFTSIPYIQGTSEKVRRILNGAGIKVAMRPVRTIGQILPSPKDPHNPEEKSCVVYQVLCSDCNFVYIGQTKRDLKSRLAEHKLAIKNQEPEKSALCEHYVRFDHLIDWINSKI